MSHAIRLAEDRDIPAITALVNLAYRAEDFFKIGERTDEADVREHLVSGVFLVIDAPDGAMAGSVYAETRSDLGYFGMLSADPERKGEGIGRALIAAAEAHCASRGCTAMELEVVNLREELLPWYTRIGFREWGTRPFVDPALSRIPCHFVVMRRPLAPVPTRHKQESHR